MNTSFNVYTQFSTDASCKVQNPERIPVLVKSTESLWKEHSKIFVHLGICLTSSIILNSNRFISKFIGERAAEGMAFTSMAVICISTIYAWATIPSSNYLISSQDPQKVTLETIRIALGELRKKTYYKKWKELNNLTTIYDVEEYWMKTLKKGVCAGYSISYVRMIDKQNDSLSSKDILLYQMLNCIWRDFFCANQPSFAREAYYDYSGFKEIPCYFGITVNEKYCLENIRNSFVNALQLMSKVKENDTSNIDFDFSRYKLAGTYIFNVSQIENHAIAFQITKETTFLYDGHLIYKIPHTRFFYALNERAKAYKRSDCPGEAFMFQIYLLKKNISLNLFDVGVDGV